MNNQVAVDEWECCEATIPAKVYFKHTGAGLVAKCDGCSYVCAYFDCACELDHDCREIN